MTKNPYHAPSAALDSTSLPGLTYSSRFLSYKGRIDRMRYLGYCSTGYLLTFAVMFLLAMAQEKYLAQLNNSAAASIIFFTVMALVAPLAVHVVYARRRLHDMGQSAWLALVAGLPLVGYLMAIYLACAPGAQEPNEYGPRAAAGKSVIFWLLAIVPALLLCLLTNFAVVIEIGGAYEAGRLSVGHSD